MNLVVCLIRDYDCNYTKSGVEISKPSNNAIYLGLVLLTLVSLKYVAFIWHLVVDDERIKIGGTATFHWISTINIQIHFYQNRQALYTPNLYTSCLGYKKKKTDTNTHTYAFNILNNWYTS